MEGLEGAHAQVQSQASAARPQAEGLCAGGLCRISTYPTGASPPKRQGDQHSCTLGACVESPPGELARPSGAWDPAPNPEGALLLSLTRSRTRAAHIHVGGLKCPWRHSLHALWRGGVLQDWDHPSSPQNPTTSHQKSKAEEHMKAMGRHGSSGERETNPKD